MVSRSDNDETGNLVPDGEETPEGLDGRKTYDIHLFKVAATDTYCFSGKRRLILGASTRLFWIRLPMERCMNISRCVSRLDPPLSVPYHIYLQRL